MPVGHVFAKANVSHNDEVRDFALDGARDLLHDSVFGPGAGGNLVLGFGKAKQDEAGNAQRFSLARLLYGFIDRKVEDARHRPDFLPHTLPGTDK